MGGKRRRKGASSNKDGQAVYPSAEESFTPAPFPSDRVRYDADDLFPKSERLTVREREAVELVAKGKNNGAIAAEMGAKKRTVESHISRALAKLGVQTRPALIVLYRDAQERLLLADNYRLRLRVEALETQLTALRQQLRRDS